MSEPKKGLFKVVNENDLEWETRKGWQLVESFVADGVIEYTDYETHGSGNGRKHPRPERFDVSAKRELLDAAIADRDRLLKQRDDARSELAKVQARGSGR